MKNSILLPFFMLVNTGLFAQSSHVDSLRALLQKSPAKDQQISLLKQLSSQQNHGPVIISFAQQGFVLATQLNLPAEEEYFLSDLCRGFHKMDNYPKELETALKGLRIAEQLHDDDKICEFAMVILISYDLGKEYDEGLPYGLIGLAMAEKTNNLFRITQLCDYIAQHYTAIGRLDSALIYMRRSNEEAKLIHEANIGFSFYGLGQIQEKLHHPDSALYFYKKAVPAFNASNVFRLSNLINAYTGISSIYKSASNYDSALYYAILAYNLSREANEFNTTYQAAGMLASVYEGKNDKESLHYYKIAELAKDSIITSDKTKQMLMLSGIEQQRRQDLLDAILHRRNQLLWTGGILLAFILLIVFYRRYRSKKRDEIEKIRSSIAADFHDELGSTLSNIALYSEIAGHYDLSDQQRTKNILSQITESSRKTISAMHDMIWSIQPKNDSLEDLLQRMREYAYPLAELKNIYLQFYIESGIQDATINMEERKNIYLIFKEALNNAFKYSEATQLTISIGNRSGGIHLELQDNGVGFEEQKIAKGNGLRNIRKRALQMGGELVLQSSVGQGTLISFTGKAK